MVLLQMLIFLVLDKFLPGSSCTWELCIGYEWRDDWAPAIKQGQCVKQHRYSHGLYKTYKGNKYCHRPSFGCAPQMPQERIMCSCTWELCIGREWRDDWAPAIKQGQCVKQHRYSHGLYKTYKGNMSDFCRPSFGCAPQMPQERIMCGSCGIRPHSRIVGGVAAKHGDWPWQAMLRTTSGSPYCGGTLVTDRWVVTATHCVRGKSPSSIIIRLGAHKRTSTVGTEQDIRVSKVITHPSYHKPTRYSYDIALLKLEKPAQLNRHVNMACLPQAVSAPTDGTKCWITGWGRLSSGGATPDILQQVQVPVVSRARCDRAYPGKIHDSMICAGQDQGGIDSCQGDSGGPMVCESGGRFYLHGVTSWGYGCAAPGKFGVYAKVKFLLNWLNTEMSNN